VSNSPSNKEQSQLFVQTPPNSTPELRSPKTSKSRPAMADNTETPPPSTLHSSRKPTAMPSRVCENRILFATKCRATQPHIDMTKTQRAKLHSLDQRSQPAGRGWYRQAIIPKSQGRQDRSARARSDCPGPPASIPTAPKEDRLTKHHRKQTATSEAAQRGLIFRLGWPVIPGNVRLRCQSLGQCRNFSTSTGSVGGIQRVG